MTQMSSFKKAHRHTGGAFAAGVAAKAKALFKIRTDLSRAAAWFARVVRPVERATTGAPAGAGLLCKLLVDTH